MPTWSLLSPPRVNREGNQIELDFYVTSVGIVPKLTHSTITIPSSVPPNNVGPFVGWRTHQTSLLQFFRGESATNEPKLFSGVVYAIDLPGSDATVSVALRLTPTSLLSCGADLRPDTYAAWIQSLGSGLVVLKATSGGSAVSSTSFTFSAGSPAELILSAYTAIVGKLPGWVAGAGIPVLRLHCDSYAERAARVATGTTYNAAIDAWTDLRLSSPNNLVQSDPALRPVLDATATTAPTVLFTSDVLEQASGYDLTQNDCAFGVTFTADAGSSTSTQHLIGRWSGQSGTDNSSKWQWRLIYERTAGSPPTHKIKAQFVYNSGFFFSVATVEATIDAPTEKTFAIYRVTTTSPTTGELWVNGALVASTTTFLPDTNPAARDLLTIGARYGGGSSLTDELAGSIDQCFVYSTAISDATLSAVMHEMARRAGVKLGPIPQSNLTQPYTDANPEPRRRLDRWPVAMINLFGGVNYDDNVLSQNENWRNGGDRQEIVDWFKPQIQRILGVCRDFEIMINRPQGNYRNDIISAGIFGDTDVAPNDPVIEDYQWDALRGWTDGGGFHPGVFGEFRLSDYNSRDGIDAGGDFAFARRCWFYTGNPTINDNGEVTQDARVGARNLAPCSASFYQESFLDPWAGADDRFRCFFVDSASKWDRKWVEIVQTPAANEAFTLVGEAITEDPNARKGAPWIALLGIRSAPWWIDFDRNNGFDWNFRAGAWAETPIYLGVTRSTDGAVMNLNDPTGSREQDALSLEDCYRFIDRGIAPVAWGGDYQKMGTAWYYGGRRIPVGRYPMMSPRISRVWR